MVDEAWSSWAHENLARGVTRGEVYDELLIAGYDPRNISLLVRTQFDAIQRQARAHVSKLRLSGEMRVHTYTGRGCEIREITNFLTPAECDHLLGISSDRLLPSEILGSEDPKYVRTSKTAQVGMLDDVILDKIDERLASLLELPRVYSEPFQLHVYSCGEFFADHTDYLPEERLDAFDVAFGQRTYSILIYVKPPLEGGKTAFPDADIAITPRQGSLVVWNNLAPDGNTNSATKHRSEPVTSGSKVILTKWFRLPNEASSFQFPGERVGSVAFANRVVKIDSMILEKLRKELSDNLSGAKAEDIAHTHLRLIDTEGAAASALISMSDEIKSLLASYARELAEAEIKRPVSDPVVYGIRQYNPNATLRMHFDRQETHHVGVLFCIERNNSEPWPLFIESERGELTSIEPLAGEALVFAGASTLHGRPRSLPDGHVWNAFVHFKLEPFL